MSVEGEPELELEFTLGEDAVQVYSAWERKAEILVFIYHYDRLLSDGKVERQTVRMAHHLVPVEGHERELATAGFRVMETYGDFDKSAYIADSPHLIFLTTVA